MKICVQWSTEKPKDWEEIDSSLWGRLQFRNLPTGNEIIDSSPGWIYSLNVMGTEWTGYDHYAVEHLPGGACRVIAWIDDEKDLVDSYYDGYARVLTYWPLGPREENGGGINTKGEMVVYCQNKIGEILRKIGPIQNTNYRNWDEFIPPQQGLIGHGIWLPDKLSDKHYWTRSKQGWRNWGIDSGVDPKLLDKNGRVLSQRPLGFYNKPQGTKTFFLRDVDQASGVHATSDSTMENSMTLAVTSGDSAEGQILTGGGSELTHLWTTESTEPNESAWPTGDYRCILDASIVGTDITFGLRAAGAVNGHFARVNTGLTSDLETKDMVESLFAAPAGLKTATTGNVSWTTGATGDRFECLVGATRAANHGNQTLEMTYDDDGFADGPWVAAAASIQAAYHHYHHNLTS